MGVFAGEGRGNNKIQNLQEEKFRIRQCDLTRSAVYSGRKNLTNSLNLNYERLWRDSHQVQFNHVTRGIWAI